MSINIEKFEDLIVWQASMDLVEAIYINLEKSKDFSFTDQIQRASVSIPSNIAEGFDRQTNKEFIQFLFIAKGSCSEVRTQLYLAKRLGKINKQVSEKLLYDSRKISSMLYKLIKTRKERFK